ncbi:DNA glycosylase [Violaceomyces palustris]|uniref:DNA glycosylase n=1 Tax=Violaceomyces palustris TaxID=1673888 RepID=A0ACD0NTF8_9BASI|nr:DNA glycosylase [Violaceomyces palustris]
MPTASTKARPPSKSRNGGGPFNSTFGFLLKPKCQGGKGGTRPASASPCLPPSRSHRLSYHRPLLLDQRDGKEALLSWFASVSKDREMPWRKDWINPDAHGAGNQGDVMERLKKRAYEVWISEIMLQQTRVETVKAYFTRWIDKWPTIEELARAEPEDVLAAWKGLGYYSRATRIHTAAKKVVEDDAMKGLLPMRPEALEKEVPGVGRYTAGAISSIVFGHAVPILDGNVARVLSRQLGLYSNPKSKVTTDLLWAAADRLVRSAAEMVLESQANDGSRRSSDTEGSEGATVDDTGADIARSETPGLWNQALMELGSTVCTPKPVCSKCPIRESCLAYAEGELLAEKAGLLPFGSRKELEPVPDIEDLCNLCEPMPDDGLALPGKDAEENEGRKVKRIKSETTNSKLEAEGGGGGRPGRGLRQQRLNFGQQSLTTKDPPGGEAIKPPTTPKEAKLRSQADEVVERHVKTFPMKVAKKEVKQEECIVCIVQRRDPKTGKSSYLLEQRPDKGLLASLWQFPSLTISTFDPNGAEGEKRGVGLKSVKGKGRTKRRVVKDEDEDDDEEEEEEEEEGGADDDDFEIRTRSSSKSKSKSKRIVPSPRKATDDDDDHVVDQGGGHPPRVVNAKEKKTSSIRFVQDLIHRLEGGGRKGVSKKTSVKEPVVDDLGSLVHNFSHLRLVMNVYHFSWGEAPSREAETLGGGGKVVWIQEDKVKEQSMGTGMMNCWSLYLSSSFTSRSADGGRKRKV